MNNELNGNQILAISVLILMVITGILFSMDNPYWYYSIITFTIAILIIIIKAMWSIAGKADEVLTRWTDVNLAPKDKDTDNKTKSKNNKKVK